MNDLKWIETNSDEAKRLLKKRGTDQNIDQLIAMFKQRRELILFSEEMKRKRNEVNDLLKSAPKSEIDKRREEMRELSHKIKESEKNLHELEEQLNTVALGIPNLPLPDVPEGTNADDNVLIKPVFSFVPKDHVELGQLTDTIDFARAAKISGARFAFLKGEGARLNRA